MWVKKLFPQTVARFSTAYNHDIRVVDEAGKYKLLVNGSRQSGEYIKRLWQHAFDVFGMKSDAKNILVLGVAGGTVIHLLRDLYPEAQITGVDIDKTMIDIGKKYFGLDAVHNLTLTVADAKDFIAKRGTWNLILCDMHIGASVPPFIGEEHFLRNTKKVLAPGGVLIINYLREFEYEKLSDLLFEKLTTVFAKVQDTCIYFNRFFLCM